MNSLYVKFGVKFSLLLSIFLSCSNNYSPLISVSVSGVAADGYLRNAKVFLDCNNNRIHDEGELSGKTQEGGEYSIEGESPCSDYTVVVDATDIDRVVDEDFVDSDGNLLTLRQAGFSNGYVLTAPKEGEKFISPFSTILTETGLDEDEIYELLGIEKGENFFEDYVKGTEKKKKLLAKAIALVLDRYLNEKDPIKRKKRLEYATVSHIDDVKNFVEDLLNDVSANDEGENFINQAKESGFVNKIDEKERIFTKKENVAEVSADDGHTVRLVFPEDVESIGKIEDLWNKFIVKVGDSVKQEDVQDIRTVFIYKNIVFININSIHKNVYSRALREGDYVEVHMKEDAIQTKKTGRVFKAVTFNPEKVVKGAPYFVGVLENEAGSTITAVYSEIYGTLSWNKKAGHAFKIWSDSKPNPTKLLLDEYVEYSMSVLSHKVEHNGGVEYRSVNAVKYRMSHERFTYPNYVKIIWNKGGYYDTVGNQNEEDVEFITKITDQSPPEFSFATESWWKGWGSRKTLLIDAWDNSGIESVDFSKFLVKLNGKPIKHSVSDSKFVSKYANMYLRGTIFLDLETALEAREYSDQELVVEIKRGALTDVRGLLSDSATLQFGYIRSMSPLVQEVITDIDNDPYEVKVLLTVKSVLKDADKSHYEIWTSPDRIPTEGTPSAVDAVLGDSGYILTLRSSTPLVKGHWIKVILVNPDVIGDIADPAKGNKATVDTQQHRIYPTRGMVLVR